MGNVWNKSGEVVVNLIGGEDVPPSFDPLYGFKHGRKGRVMHATEEEMRAARIPQDKRDYCAHHFLKLEQCRYDKMPWTIKCAPEKHAWDLCYYEDYVLRMKEYERERRLLERQQRKEQTLNA